MIGTSVKNSRMANTVMLHFLTGAFTLIILCALVYFSASAFIGHYFNPKLLSITHITTIGWISMVIIGALYQIAPAIANKELYSIKLTYIAFFLLLAGTITFTISFWYFEVGYPMQVGSLMLLSGITLFVLNILFTLHGTKENTIVSDFISTSVCWFWLTAILGTLMVYNLKYAFLNNDHLYFLKIHVHIGVIGWFANLIIGVASKLIPMFLIAGKLNEKPLSYCYYLLNIALFGFVIDSLFFNGFERNLLYTVPILISIFIFCFHIFTIYKNRLRKKLDIGIQQTTISLILIFIPITLTILLKSRIIANPLIIQQVSIGLTFSMLFGFITLLILGQTLKNLSYIAWLKINDQNNSYHVMVLPKDLYSHKAAQYQLYFFLFGFFTMLTGILASIQLFILIGALSLCITSLFYAVNVLKIIRYKPQ